MKFRTALLGFVLCGMAALVGASQLTVRPQPQIQPAAGFEKTAMDATLALYAVTQNDSGQKQAHYLCTAFVIQQDATGYTLLSAGHCVSNLPIDSTFAVSEKIEEGALYPVTPIAARFDDVPTDVEDYSEFHLTTTNVYPVLQLGDESSEQVGSDVLVPHFAFGLGEQLASGKIASQLLHRTSYCPNCAGEFIIHATAGLGASGAPVISATTHQVIGILTAEFENAGFIIEPISAIQKSMLLPNQFEDLHQIQPPDFKNLFGAPSNQ